MDVSPSKENLGYDGSAASPRYGGTAAIAHTAWLFCFGEYNLVFSKKLGNL
jgi:hypothetical protein